MSAPLDELNFHLLTVRAVFSENSSMAGTLGGLARAASLTPRQRTNIARTAAKARWSSGSV